MKRTTIGVDMAWNTKAAATTTLRGLHTTHIPHCVAIFGQGLKRPFSQDGNETDAWITN